MRPVLVITGGIGAGKSYVSAKFARCGIPVYDSDSRTKGLYDTDRELLATVARLAGSDIIREGRLDRELFASRIFSDRCLLAEIEEEVFPAVIRDFRAWNASFTEEVPFVIMESAIFLMKPILHPIADRVLYVDAPLELRIERVMKRDSATRERVLERIRNQKDCSTLADWIIDTSLGDEYLDREVVSVVSKMLYLHPSNTRIQNYED